MRWMSVCVCVHVYTYTRAETPSYPGVSPHTIFRVNGQPEGTYWLLISGEQQHKEDEEMEGGFVRELRVLRGYRCQY